VSGDNLGKIAQKYKVTVSEIKKWNKLKSDKIVIGQKLTIIKNKQVKSEVTSVNTDEKTLLNNQDNSTQNNTEPETNKDKNIEKPEWVIYKVKSGDTVWKISQKYNVSSSSIISLNNIKNNNIYPGQILKIKKK
jgi:LysM repeat protein